MSLRNETCVPTVPRLDDAACAALLQEVSAWSIADGQLRCTRRFSDYTRTMAFVNAVARLADAEDHHPELVVNYGSCEVRFWTHSVGGLSRNDFICAAKVDALPEAG